MDEAIYEHSAVPYVPLVDQSDGSELRRLIANVRRYRRNPFRRGKHIDALKDYICSEQGVPYTSLELFKEVVSVVNDCFFEKDIWDVLSRPVFNAVTGSSVYWVENFKPWQVSYNRYAARIYKSQYEYFDHQSTFKNIFHFHFNSNDWDYHILSYKNVRLLQVFLNHHPLTSKEFGKLVNQLERLRHERVYKLSYYTYYFMRECLVNYVRQRVLRDFKERKISDETWKYIDGLPKDQREKLFTLTDSHGFSVAYYCRLKKDAQQIHEFNWSSAGQPQFSTWFVTLEKIQAWVKNGKPLSAFGFIWMTKDPAFLQQVASWLMEVGFYPRQEWFSERFSFESVLDVALRKKCWSSAFYWMVKKKQGQGLVECLEKLLDFTKGDLLGEDNPMKGLLPVILRQYFVDNTNVCRENIEVCLALIERKCGIYDVEYFVEHTFETLQGYFLHNANLQAILPTIWKVVQEKQERVHAQQNIPRDCEAVFINNGGEARAEFFVKPSSSATATMALFQRVIERLDVLTPDFLRRLNESHLATPEMASVLSHLNYKAFRLLSRSGNFVLAEYLHIEKAVSYIQDVVHQAWQVQMSRMASMTQVDEDKIAQLINGGLCLAVRDKIGKTMLHYALDKGFLAIAQMLIEKDATLLEETDRWGVKPDASSSQRSTLFEYTPFEYAK